MHTLYEDGMIKAIRGMTTIEEVLRITQREAATEASAPKKPSATES
jgi:type IV pilus assembly protein PilB